MNDTLHTTVYMLFILTTILGAYFFYRATSLNAVIIVVAWIILQGAVAMTGFYMNIHVMPPRFIFLVAPPFITILLFFITAKGRALIDSCNDLWLTWFQSIRLPVELTLYGLYIYKLVPGLMTFEGVNFDILTGISAPFIAYFGYIKKRLGKRIIIAWNIIGLILFFNIVIRAILSLPTPFQQFAFDQPNIGVLMFPFIWLPCFIVPAAFFAHLVCLRKLLR